MKFGENLRTIRKNKKISQEQLAEKIDVSRQSISKWETGDAYPEMNNILQLCKIFNCKINDLIHADMSDISSLDEEIVMSVVKFNNKKQKQVKSLSNVIELIGKIGGIVLKVAIPFIIIAMLIIPYIINNVEIKENNLSFKTNNIKIVSDDTIEIFDIGVINLEDNLNQQEIINIFNNNSKLEVIIYTEIGFVFLLVNLVIMIIIFKYVEKLFNNIKNNHTPFTMGNVNYIKSISYLMIALILITPVSGMIFNYTLKMPNESSNFGLISILEILIIFSMSYIFEYGYEIQKDSKGKMYDNEKQTK